MLHRIVAAGFQDIVEANHVALDVRIGILDTIPHTGLGGQVHNDIEVVFSEQFVNQRFVRQIPLREIIPVLRMPDHGLFNDRKPILLQARIVIIVQVVQAHNLHRLFATEQTEDQIGAYKSGTAGNKNRFHQRPLYMSS